MCQPLPKTVLTFFTPSQPSDPLLTLPASKSPETNSLSIKENMSTDQHENHEIVQVGETKNTVEIKESDSVNLGGVDELLREEVAELELEIEEKHMLECSDFECLT